MSGIRVLQNLTPIVTFPKPIYINLVILGQLRLYNHSGRPLTRLAVELSLTVFIWSSELRFARCL